ncbi:hypothetical protein DQ04_09011030 [Trypanosoma grayi]|uniref:hypothetical protein n=1 Tax=Trypanosoma grayi TaxID=71804 RepID=UPI0004F3F3C3|nr:hypothetical protein DQ04_09011030 [Trypanosoma grayi]KEG07714.1 hypothetical protein DQ04_09011030 [Trypanosoma grayi]
METGAPLVRFRQLSFTYGDGDGSSLLHVSQQCFADYIWVLVTEDDTCAPGVVLRYDPQEAGPSSSWESADALPSTPCECLLGLRDHPLTNVLAGAIAYTIQREGERRPLLLCISVTKTSKRLQSAADRMAFVREVRDKLMSLATGEQE